MYFQTLRHLCEPSKHQTSILYKRNLWDLEELNRFPALKTMRCESSTWPNIRKCLRPVVSVAYPLADSGNQTLLQRQIAATTRARPLVRYKNPPRFCDDFLVPPSQRCSRLFLVAKTGLAVASCWEKSKSELSTTQSFYFSFWIRKARHQPKSIDGGRMRAGGLADGFTRKIKSVHTGLL